MATDNFERLREELRAEWKRQYEGFSPEWPDIYGPVPPAKPSWWRRLLDFLW